MIKKLDAQTLKDLYEREMKDTFPRAELKPFKAMLRMQADGHYDALGYYDDETGALLAYACTCTAGSCSKHFNFSSGSANHCTDGST